MDKHQVSQAGQRLFRVTHLLLQKACHLFSPQQRPEHKAGEGLSDGDEGVLQKTDAETTLTKHIHMRLLQPFKL